MKLYELLRDGVPVGEVVEFTNGRIVVAARGGTAISYLSLAEVEADTSLDGCELVRRHAPHAFRADRQAYGEVRA